MTDIEMNETEPYEEMNERDFCELLGEALFEYAENNDREEPDIQTFEEAGLLTKNKGIVVRLGEMEFQVSIVRRH
jgi:hypothetical protein